MTKQSTVTNKLETFFGKFPKLEYKLGHVIVPAYSQPAGVYLVKSGLVRQYLMDASGRELTINLYKPSSFFPMIPLVTGLPNRFFFECFQDSVVWRAPKQDFLEFLRADNEIMFDLITRLYVGIDGLAGSLGERLLGDSVTGVCAGLVLLMKRFGVKEGRHIVIREVFLQRDLAAVTGVARETVSRVLNELEQSGVIVRESKQIRVLQEKVLLSQAGSLMK